MLKKEKALHWRWALFGAMLMCITLSLFAFLLEFYFPTRSGIGADREWQMLGLYVPVAVLILSFTNILAALLKWKSPSSRAQHLCLGAVCGLSQSYELLPRIHAPMGQDSDLIFLCLLIVAAVAARYGLSISAGS